MSFWRAAECFKRKKPDRRPVVIKKTAIKSPFELKKKHYNEFGLRFSALRIILRIAFSAGTIKNAFSLRMSSPATLAKVVIEYINRKSVRQIT